MRIVECNSNDEINATFAIMSQLRPHLEESQYVALIRELQQTENLCLVAVFAEDDCIAVAGYTIIRCLFNGGKPKMFVNDLVTDESRRGQGIGKFLLNFLKQKCRELQYIGIVLDSGMQRIDAHHFYEHEEFQKVAFHFDWTVA